MRLVHSLQNAVEISHLFLREKVRTGDRVVDATCGNGHDTLFLAELVGTEGTVFAFDVQELALEKTGLSLEGKGLADRVRLIHAGHEHLAAHVAEPVQAVVFNLGYLPGSDKSCITRPETTIAALEAAAHILCPGGIIVIVVYPGHSGGSEEAAAVERWATSLSRSFSAWRSSHLNRSSTSPYVVAVEKLSE